MVFCTNGLFFLVYHEFIYNELQILLNQGKQLFAIDFYGEV
ncbi:hypothetical protein [Vagococcus carniphilus]